MINIKKDILPLLINLLQKGEAKPINVYLELGNLYRDKKEIDDTGQPEALKLEDYFI